MEYDPETGEPVCVTCHGPDPEYTHSPFKAEIRGDYTKDWYCRDCLYESRQDI